MNVKTQMTKKHKTIINVIIVAIISLVITFAFSGFNLSLKANLLSIGYGLLIGFSLALGSSNIASIMLKSFSGNKSITRKYVKLILLVSLFILIDLVIINLVWFKITQNRTFYELLHTRFFIIVFFVEVSVGLLVFLIVLSSRFFKKYNAYFQRAEEARREVEKYKFETLKNQVNPHFLFNSLNVLSGLIYIDIEKADWFINHLSQIYRYVLDNQDKEIIPVKDEIKFIKTYINLQKIRFEDSLQAHINVNSEKYIVPMSLQILTENAIKHNNMSGANKLLVEIFENEDYIVVRNNVLPILAKTDSHETGLKNIEKRYSFLTDRKCRVLKNENIFEVKIPLLTSL